jgi:hypothetical protein
MRIPVEADASVEKVKANENFGSAPVLRVRASGKQDKRAYLRFDLTGFKGGVGEARLVLHVVSEAPTRKTLNDCWAVAKDDWDESTITWANKPERDGKKLSCLDLNGRREVSFVVTPAVAEALAAGRRKITLEVANRFNSLVGYSSKEGPVAKRPALVITPTDK